jgi:hypothetical protein
MEKDWVFEEIAVECYSGYKGEEYPRFFAYQNRRFEVLEILDRWYEGGMNPAGILHNYFRVTIRGGEIFLLRYTPRFQTWTLCRKIPGSGFSNN